MMGYTVRILEAGDEAVLEQVAPDVFDGPLDARLVTEFLSDPRHHISVAIEDGMVVGMATAVHYVHPDKQPELFINEIGVAPALRGRGVGKQLLEALFERGTQHGCATAWVLTDTKNERAAGLFKSVGGAKASGGVEMYEFRLARDRGRKE